MLSTLTKAADIADRILLARFEQLESSSCPIPAETFEKSLDYWKSGVGQSPLTD